MRFALMSAHLVKQALAFQEVEQRLLQQRAIVAREFRRVRLNRTFLIALAQAEKAAAGFHLGLADQHLVVGATWLGRRRQRHLLGLPALGDRLDGRIPEEDTPRVVAAIARHYLEHRKDGEAFRDFVGRVGAAEITKASFAVVDTVI